MTYDLPTHSVTGLNLAFAGGLHQHNCGEGYWDPEWEIVAIEPDGPIALQKNNLTVQADPQRHLHPDRPWTIGDRVDLKLPKNLVEGDRYVAVGNAGVPGRSDRQVIPFELQAEQVNALIQHLTEGLNQLNLPFTLACFYDPLNYPDPEAALLTVNTKDRTIVESIVQKWENLTWDNLTTP